MSHRDRLVFLALICLGPLCGALLATSGVPAPLSIAAGLLLVLVLPGFALQRALFTSGSLDVPTTIAFVIGLSLSLSILGGFVLNGTADGLTASGWGVLLGGATLVAAIVGWVRFTWREWHGSPATTRDRDTATEAASDVETDAATDSVTAPRADGTPADAPAGSPAPSRQAAPRIPRFQQAMVAVAVVLVVVALGVARIGVDSQPHDGFAEFWMLEDPPGAVRVGVSNHEGSQESYQVQVAVDGVQLRPEDSVSLADGQQTEVVVNLPVAASPTPGPSAGHVAGAQAHTRVVTAALFHEGDSQAFRTVRITVPVP